MRLGRKIALGLIVLMLLAALIGYIYQESRKVVKFEATDIYFNEDPDTGSLKGIIVSGYLVHSHWKEVDLREVKFVCDAPFLEDNLNEGVTASLEDDTVYTLEDGEKAKFEVDLGWVTDTTTSRTAQFKVVFRDVVNDVITIDVTNYYK